MKDRIAKQRLNVILLIDCSTSMRGERISTVNSAIKEINSHLIDMQKENTNVDFYMTIVTFSTEARLYKGDKMKNVEEFDFQDIWAGGWSNLHTGYAKLEELLKKESKGGMMPDFGGVAPIILLLTDGHPTGEAYKDELDKLKKLSWFNASLRYGIAIELFDKKTQDVLHDFVGNNGEVFGNVDVKKLKNMMKVIILTASKVKSSSSSVSPRTGSNVSSTAPVTQEIAKALDSIDDWEW